MQWHASVDHNRVDTRTEERDIVWMRTGDCRKQTADTGNFAECLGSVKSGATIGEYGLPEFIRQLGHVTYAVHAKVGTRPTRGTRRARVALGMRRAAWPLS